MNFRSLTLLLTLLFALPVHADGEAPDALVNRVSGEVLQTHLQHTLLACIAIGLCQ